MLHYFDPINLDIVGYWSIFAIFNDISYEGY